MERKISVKDIIYKHIWSALLLAVLVSLSAACSPSDTPSSHLASTPPPPPTSVPSTPS